MINYCNKRNWHPAANLFPLLEPDELKELAADIAEHGLLNPVVLLDGKVLDGRNRVLACKLARVKPEFVAWEQNGIPAVAWVIAQNLHRRHLAAGQRAAVAVEAKPLLAAEIKPGRPKKNGANNGTKWVSGSLTKPQ
jgi:ParB-like chromosome segregation protein Spo0J